MDEIRGGDQKTKRGRGVEKYKPNPAVNTSYAVDDRTFTLGFSEKNLIVLYLETTYRILFLIP